MRLRICLLLAAAAIATNARAAGNCSNLVGDWKNELGSTLSVTSVNAATGAIAGTYSSPSGTSGQKFALVGWTNSAAAQPGKDNATAVAFSVRWGNYGSITSWTGTCKEVNGVATIHTLWHLAASLSNFSWDHINSNTDVFTPK